MAKKQFKNNAKSLLNDINQEDIVSNLTLNRIPQRDKISRPLKIYKRNLNKKQEDFFEIAKNKKNKIIIVSGPAGSSKTFLAILVGLELLNEKKVSDLIYVRSVVESGDTKMGYLPGEKEDKLAPYLEPLLDKLQEFLPKEDINFLQKEQRVTGMPINYLRGLNWNAKCIVSDESQNCTRKELITLMTRMGEFSKLFILGDPSQSDIGQKSGFKEIFNLFNDANSSENGVVCFEFNEDDIVRSELVKFLLKKFKEILDSKKDAK